MTFSAPDTNPNIQSSQVSTAWLSSSQLHPPPTTHYAQFLLRLFALFLLLIFALFLLLILLQFTLSSPNSSSPANSH